MIRWQTIAGIALGLTAGATVLSLLERGPAASPAAGAVLSECDGAIQQLVIHYEPGSRSMVAPVYQQLLQALDPDIEVAVVCPDMQAFDELKSIAGDHRCHLTAVVVNHPITTWSRDRWVALGPPAADEPTALLCPLGEKAAEVWPARAGDELTAGDLEQAFRPHVRAIRSELYFDGGDFMANNDHVFVVDRVLPRNLQYSVHSREGLIHVLTAQLQRPVVWLDNAPDHHAGMFMAVAGEQRILVGDPSLAAPFLTNTQLDGLPGGPDFRSETQQKFDGVAAQCRAMGYHVQRIPVVPARDGRTYFTYCNVLIDHRAGHRIVYLPFYQGLDTLNAEARRIWEGLGFEIRPVDCTSVYHHFGCLHCLVNVLRRE